jgi:hypothetical protein
VTRAAAVVATLAALALAAAATAAAHSRDPVQRHTASDTRRAQALALRRNDLAAGWKTDKPSKPGPPCTAGPDESSIVQTARVDPSFTWKDGVTSVGSEVDILRSAREARRDWSVSTLDLMMTCLLQSARAGVGKTVHVTLVSATRLAAPKSAERALHYRFVFALHSKQAVQLVADVIALGRGRITLVLHTLTVRTPLPAAVVGALVGVLADRLNAGSLAA